MCECVGCPRIINRGPLYSFSLDSLCVWNANVTCPLIKVHILVLETSQLRDIRCNTSALQLQFKSNFIAAFQLQ